MPTKNTKYALNATRVVERLGGVSNIVSGLEAMGHPITRDAVEKWRLRQMIPMERWLQLVDFAKSMKANLSLREFIIREPIDAE